MFVSTRGASTTKLVVLILCFSYFSDHSVLGEKGFRRPCQSRGAYRSVHVHDISHFSLSKFEQ
jgi:hypothetical protein